MKARFVLERAAAVALFASVAACSAGGGGKAPAIEAFPWTEKAAYCAFLPSGTKFDAADKSTWEFVFVTDPQPGEPVENAPAILSIDGVQTTFNRDLEAPGADGANWIYKAEGGALTVALTLDGGADVIGGATGGPQNGTLRVIAPAKGKAQEIIGGCGI